MMTAAVATPADVETRFGTFPVAPADIVHFATGVPGFEQCRRFVLVTAFVSSSRFPAVSSRFSSGSFSSSSATSCSSFVSSVFSSPSF